MGILGSQVRLRREMLSWIQDTPAGEIGNPGSAPMNNSVSDIDIGRGCAPDTIDRITDVTDPGAVDVDRRAS